MNRRSFFSRLAGLALVPALARFRPEQTLRAMIVSRRRAAFAEMSAEWDACFWPSPSTGFVFHRTGRLWQLDETGRNWQYIPPYRQS